MKCINEVSYEYLGTDEDGLHYFNRRGYDDEVLIAKKVFYVKSDGTRIPLTSNYTGKISVNKELKKIV